MKKLFDFFRSPKVENNFNVLPDGIFTLEQDGKIVDVNDKILEMYNSTRFEFLGRYFSDCVEGGTSVLNEVIKNNNYVCARAKLKADMPEMTLEISTIRSKDNNRVYVSARDVTDKEKEQYIMQEKYRAAQRIIDEKNDFLLTSSGSILSSLVSIEGFSRSLLNGIGGALSEKQTKYLNIINTFSNDLSYDLEKLFTLFRVESSKVEYNFKSFDLISLIKTINRIYEKIFKDKKISFKLDYSELTQRDCCLDEEIVEYIIKCVMDIFVRFSNLGKCSLNIGHPPLDFLKTMNFEANTSPDCEKYILFEAKITDLVFDEDELNNIFDTYYKASTKRPIGLKASLNLMKRYITDFKGDIWVYSKQNFGTMFTFVLPAK